MRSARPILLGVHSLLWRARKRRPFCQGYLPAPSGVFRRMHRWQWQVARMLAYCWSGHSRIRAPVGFHTILRCAGLGAPTTPVLLFEDVANPANNIECFIGVTGCIGDVPFTAMMANACGHSGKKGCKYCFLLGQSFNDQDEPLGTVRFCGCDSNAVSTQAHVFDASGFWSSVPACFVDGDNRFDQQRADSLKITPDLQLMRERSAMDKRAAARLAHPPPVRPDNARDGNQAQLDWEKGACSPTRWLQFVSIPK